MSFYAGTYHSTQPHMDPTPMKDMDCDEGRENLDLMVNIREIEEQEKGVMTLGNAFNEDGPDRTQHLDIQYLTGLKRSNISGHTESAVSATPKIATHVSPQSSTQVASTRCMNV